MIGDVLADIEGETEVVEEASESIYNGRRKTVEAEQAVASEGEEGER